ncbi:MAG: MCE family protein [Bacteroidales bacterium]|nr:MCE family protein [Bacteroidales bacterium]
MKSHTQQYKVRLGLFVIGGIALFVLAIFIIGKQQNLFNPVFNVTATFYNVSGLQVGNNVRFSGINVGTVNNISIINDSTVRVDMIVRREIQQFIKADSEVAIGSEGLIGDRLLIITQGSSDAPIVAEGQELTSKEPIETDAIIASLAVTSGNVEVITKQLAEIMIGINKGEGTLGLLLQDTATAKNIDQTIANFKKSSEGLDQTIEITKDNVFAFMESLKVTAGKTEIASQELGEIMTKINSGEGALGMLIQDTLIAVNINKTITNLESSTKGLDENMEALKNSFLFRRYFRKKAEREALEKLQDDKNPEKEIELELPE